MKIKITTFQVSNPQAKENYLQYRPDIDIAPTFSNLKAAKKWAKDNQRYFRK